MRVLPSLGPTPEKFGLVKTANENKGSAMKIRLPSIRTPGLLPSLCAFDASAGLAAGRGGNENHRHSTETFSASATLFPNHP
jgi:hypothetical protein